MNFETNIGMRLNDTILSLGLNQLSAQSVSRVDPDADLLLELLEGHLGVLALRRRPLAVHVDRRAPDVRLEDDDGEGQEHEVEAAEAVLWRGRFIYDVSRILK